MNDNIDRLLVILNTVDSTNNYAMGIINDGLAEAGLTVMAMEQTEGKGRQGKTWLSSPGKNLMCSIIVPADELNIHNQFKLVASVALACTAFIKIFLPVESSIKIKWPNDIYISDRKAGGILIENKIIGSKWRWVVVGVGINVNQTEFEGELAQHATSLKIETHQDYDVVTLVKELSKTITLDVANLPFVRDEEVMRSYNSLLYQKNKIVKLKKNNMVFETTIKSVDRGGNLLTSDVLDRAFTVNEISWIL